MNRRGWQAHPLETVRAANALGQRDKAALGADAARISESLLVA
jgi:hypothetical protein